MNFKLISREEKSDLSTLHLTPVSTKGVSFPDGIAWSRLWQANAQSELQMDVSKEYAASLAISNIYILG